MRAWPACLLFALAALGPRSAVADALQSQDEVFSLQLCTRELEDISRIARGPSSYAAALPGKSGTCADALYAVVMHAPREKIAAYLSLFADIREDSELEGGVWAKVREENPALAERYRKLLDGVREQRICEVAFSRWLAKEGGRYAVVTATFCPSKRAVPEYRYWINAGAGPPTGQVTMEFWFTSGEDGDIEGFQVYRQPDETGRSSPE